MIIGLVVTVALVMALAAVVDQLLDENAVREWRTKSHHMAREVRRLNVAELTTSANKWFLGLFDAIYGDRPMSIKRFTRSGISSLLALVLSSIILGWDRTPLGAYADSKISGLLGIAELEVVIGGSFLAVLILINLVADYASLAETRMIMRLSQDSSFYGLLVWAAIDLVFTTIVFFIFFFVIAVHIYFGEPILTLSQYFEVMVRDLDAFLSAEIYFTFLLSTFFTSALWIMFLSVNLVVRVVARSSKIVAFAFRTIAESDAPAKTAGGLICILIALIELTAVAFVG